jgi:hypothetical protein
MAAYLSPVGNEAQIDTNGDPLSGGKIFTYLAGTTTLTPTYTSSTGGTPQSNPIILNSHGLPTLGPIWLGAGVAIKMVFTDLNGVAVRDPIDNIIGVNDPSSTTAQDEWVTFSGTPTYLSATSFSVAGDQTPTFQVRRRVKTSNAGGSVYSSIATSSFGAGITTVTLTNDAGMLDSGLSAVSYGMLSVTNPSIPETATGKLLRQAATASAARTAVDSLAPTFSAYQTGAAQVIPASVFTKVTMNAEEFDTASCFDTTNSRFTPNVAGYYQFTGAVIAIAATTLVVAIYKNGAVAKYGNGVNTNTTGVTVATPPILMNGTTDYVELFGFSSSTPTMSTGTAGCYFGGHLVRAI